jgi:hypothetical protein
MFLYLHPDNQGKWLRQIFSDTYQEKSDASGVAGRTGYFCLHRLNFDPQRSDRSAAKPILE